MAVGRRRRQLLLVVGLVLALTGCSQAIEGQPVLSPRVLAAVKQYKTCTAGIVATTSSLDTLLDTVDQHPVGASVDGVAIGRFFDGMRRVLNDACGYWAEQSRPQSAVVLHLSEQLRTRPAATDPTIVSMITSICGSVEGPLDQSGVNLSPRAHEVCAVA